MTVFLNLVKKRDKSLIAELGELDEEDHKSHSYIFYSIVEVISQKHNKLLYMIYPGTSS
jgi:hypothetical protein